MESVLTLCIICCLFRKKYNYYNLEFAHETLNLNFLQEMQAERYISFILQDINYILMVMQMLKNMSAKEIQPDDLKEFIKDRYLSYQKYAATMCLIFSFPQTEPTIQPTPAMEKYLYSYKELMNDPLYFAVGLLPCVRLWVCWKVNNMDGHPEKHYKGLLNKHLDTPEKEQKANEIFHKQMQNEHEFFKSS
uniref:Uncharacterized protein n=1 Tax=Cyprinus carpio TaxID=7962 RepID=A0A8C2FE02_CYPCA